MWLAKTRLSYHLYQYLEAKDAIYFFLVLMTFIIHSFVPLSYKLGLVRTLVDRVFNINNTWFGFHDNIKELTNILGKNMFPWCIVDIIKCYLNKSLFLSTFPPLSATMKHWPITINYRLLALFLTRFNAKSDVLLLLVLKMDDVSSEKCTH